MAGNTVVATLQINGVRNHLFGRPASFNELQQTLLDLYDDFTLAGQQIALTENNLEITYKPGRYAKPREITDEDSYTHAWNNRRELKLKIRITPFYFRVGQRQDRIGGRGSSALLHHASGMGGGANPENIQQEPLSLRPCYAGQEY